MPDDPILFSERDGIARLTLNRPDRLNAFNAAMHQAIAGALDHVEASATLRVLVITGAGRAFCAGQDLGERDLSSAAAPDLGASLDRTYNPMIRRLTALPLPVVAVVNGVAAGAGANLALSGADLVIAAKSARFLQAFAKIGLLPDAGGTWSLPRLVGLPRALGLALLAEPLGAEDAERWGLIWKAVDDAALHDEAEKLVTALAQAPTRALAAIKAAMRQGLDRDLSSQLDVERDLQRALGQTADYREGVNAFKEKRKAKFEGR